MLRFSAHLSFLYLELPFAERMEAAKRAGFPGVECAVPEIPATEMSRRAQELGLAIVGINTAPGEAESERLGFAALPGREKAFARNLDAALDYAATAGASHVHVLSGLIDGIAREEAEATFMRNMETGIRSAEKAGVRLVIEGLNSRDRPGYFLSRSQDAFDIVDRFGSPWLRAMFDTYHAQIMEGDILARDRRKPLADRPYPDLRRAWPDGARFRRIEPSRSPCGDRSARLGGFHRLRIQAAHHHCRRSRLDEDAGFLIEEPRPAILARRASSIMARPHIFCDEHALDI